MAKKTTKKKFRKNLGKAIVNGDFKIFNQRELARRTGQCIQANKDNLPAVLKDIKHKVAFFDKFSKELENE